MIQKQKKGKKKIMSKVDFEEIKKSINVVSDSNEQENDKMVGKKKVAASDIVEQEELVDNSDDAISFDEAVKMINEATGVGRTRYSAEFKAKVIPALHTGWEEFKRTSVDSPSKVKFSESIKPGFYPTCSDWMGWKDKKAQKAKKEQKDSDKSVKLSEFTVALPQLEAYNIEVMSKFWDENLDAIEEFLGDKVMEMFVTWNKERMKKRV